MPKNTKLKRPVGRPRVTSTLLTGRRDEDRKKLNILLIEAGLTKQQIADELGISRQAVTSVINRYHNSSTVFRYLERIAI